MSDKHPKDQTQHNKFLEGGIFYPTGHLVLGFDGAELAARAAQALAAAGFDGDGVVRIDAATMAREARKNLDDKGFLSAGASVPTRQKQLELAEDGCHFLLVDAPETEDHERALAALKGIALRYGVKYRKLIIENLVGEAPRQAADAEPARVP